MRPFPLGDGVFALLAQPVPRDNIGVIFGSESALIVDVGITPHVGPNDTGDGAWAYPSERVP